MEWVKRRKLGKPRGGFLKIISVGILTYTTSFHADVSTMNRFSYRRRSECRLKQTLKSSCSIWPDNCRGSRVSYKLRGGDLNDGVTVSRQGLVTAVQPDTEAIVLAELDEGSDRAYQVGVVWARYFFRGGFKKQAFYFCLVFYLTNPKVSSLLKDKKCWWCLLHILNTNYYCLLTNLQPGRLSFSLTLKSNNTLWMKQLSLALYFIPKLISVHSEQLISGSLG